MTELTPQDPILKLIELVNENDAPNYARTKGRAVNALERMVEKYGCQTVGEFADQFDDFRHLLQIGNKTILMVKEILTVNNITTKTVAGWKNGRRIAA